MIPREHQPDGRRALLPESLCWLTLILVMAASWFLIHGTMRAVYDEMATQGVPSRLQGPVGEAGRNQLGPWGYFWSERAFHYRTTLMFAVDDYTPVSTLAHDTAQQFPDGVNAWSEYTLLMEPVYGTLYRWFAREGEILVEFLIRLIPLLHVLMFIPLFLAARVLSGKSGWALLAVIAYATCSLGFARFSGALLLKENFALLLLMGFLAAHFQALATRKRGWLLGAGVLLLGFLASWHLSQFLALVILGSVAWTQCRDREVTGAWAWQVPAVYLIACLLAGLTPSLWARSFLVSLTMVVPVSWLGTVMLTRGRRLSSHFQENPSWILLALVLILGGLSFLNRHFTGDYNHIFGLLVQKVLHGFQRPDDPRQLPFDVRVFWGSPFNTPTWDQIWGKLGLHLLSVVAAGAMIVSILPRRRLDTRQQSVLIMALGFLIGWFMIERLGVVFWPVGSLVLAVAAAHAWTQKAALGRAGRWILPGVVLAAAVGNLFVNLDDRIAVVADVVRGREVRVGASDQIYWGFRTDLLRWINRNTPGPQCRFGDGQALPILGEIGISPQVLLYTGRPIVLNSQFENQPIRRRYHEYLKALFSEDPLDLGAFIRKTGTGYLFINRQWTTLEGPGSAAYLAGVSGPLKMGMNICRLQFHPDSLDYLQPVYNNEFFRVFKVVERKSTDAATWERNHGNWWNPERFTIHEGVLTDLMGDRQRLQDHEKDLVALQEGLAFLLQASTPSPGRGPSLPALHQQYVQLKLAQLQASPGTPEYAGKENEIQQVVAAIQGLLARKDPRTGRPLGRALAGLLTGGIGPDQPGWQDVLSRGDNEPTHLASAAQLLALIGQYSQAADLMLQAAAFFPELPTIRGDGRADRVATPLVQQIRQTAVGYLLAAGRTREAADQARLWRPYTEPGSPVDGFFAQVAAEVPQQ